MPQRLHQNGGLLELIEKTDQNRIPSFNFLFEQLEEEHIENKQPVNKGIKPSTSYMQMTPSFHSFNNSFLDMYQQSRVDFHEKLRA